jgi:hypothetical protein
LLAARCELTAARRGFLLRAESGRPSVANETPELDDVRASRDGPGRRLLRQSGSLWGA